MITLITDDLALLYKMIQVGQTFTYRKEFLYRRKVIPVPGTDLPPHQTCNILGVHAGGLGKNLYDLIQPSVMMGGQIPDPLVVVPLLPVSGESQGYRIGAGSP